MTPIFRWVGGKKRLLPAVDEIIGSRPIRNYYETFLGGGALYFHLHERIKEQAYLNDMNIDLIEAYNQIKDKPHAVVQHLMKLRADGASYYEMRHEFNVHLHSASLMRRAALFLALNHMCFNGLWRVSKSGLMNTPQGSDGNKKPRTLANFPFGIIPLGSAALKKATLSAVPFQILVSTPHTSLQKAGEGDVVFFDPPYLDVFAAYSKETFGPAEHALLAVAARRLASQGALVILCGSDTDASLDVYGEPRGRVGLKRTVGASKRGEVQECLWVYGK